jgi:hypothetical protein
VDEASEEVEAVVSNPDCPIQEAYLLAGLVRQKRRDGPGARTLFDRCVAMAPRACIAAECRRYASMPR